MASRAGALIELIEVMGEEATERLRQHFGGTEVHVPLEIGDEHRICRALGRADADRLGAWAGGGKINVPKGDARGLRDRILQLRRDGRTTAEIALECGLSQRHVFRLLREARDDAAA